MFLLLLILASYRVSLLIAADEGPYKIFDKFRKHLGQIAAKRGQGFWWEFSELFHCPFCLGVWMSLVLLPLYVYPSDLGNLFLLWMGVTGGQNLLQKLR